MKRAIWIVLAVFGMSLAALDGACEARTYKIGTAAWAGFSPVNAADAKGFFKEEGLDVKVFTAGDGFELKNMIEKQLVDLALDMIGVMAGYYMDGMPIQILAETDWSHGGDKIIVKKGLDVQLLKTKPIGLYFNQPAVTFFLNSYLKENHVKFSEVKVLEMEVGTLAAHFIEGRFGAIVAYNPEALRAEREGGGSVAATTATYEGCMPEGVMGRKEVVDSMPHEDLVKFFKAWIKAAQWCSDPANWVEYMRILNEHTFKGLPPFSENDLKEMVGAVRIHDPAALKSRNAASGGLETYLIELKSFLVENNQLKKDFTPESLLRTKSVQDALAGN